MAIHSNHEDFSVEFTHTFLSGETSNIPVKWFVEDVNDWEPSRFEYAIVRENIDLKMTFSCRKASGRCTMDGFDILPAEHLEEDHESGLLYIKSGNITLFKHDSGIEYYPYIPGVYCITVNIEGKNYYSFVKVISNRLTDKQLETMRREVEEQSRGLALDVVRKQTVFQNIEDINLDNTLLHQFNILRENFREISAIIADLSKRVRTTLKKEYIVQPLEKPLYVDITSIQYRLRHPESTNYVKVRRNRVDYDLPENRVLKRIINRWVHILTEFCQQIECNLEKLTVTRERIFSSYTPGSIRGKIIEDLEDYRTTALQMKGALNSLRARSWYQEIGIHPDSVISSKMYADPRYNKILKIHKKVMSNEISFSLHSAWNYHWKRTDQLYEIWGFFQVLKAFKESHFQTLEIKGWSLDDLKGRRQDLLIIPAIPKGTMFKMQKGNLRVNIVFDGYIPKEMSETDRNEVPVYTTSTHNNPDIRADVYIGDIFIGNILMDTKYRKKEALENSRYQLISYADNVHSPYIYNKRRWKRLRPVHSVLVLYPDKKGETVIDSLPGKNISLVPLTPNMAFNDFYHLIEGLLDELIKDAEDAGVLLE